MHMVVIHGILKESLMGTNKIKLYLHKCKVLYCTIAACKFIALRIQFDRGQYYPNDIWSFVAEDTYNYFAY